MEKDIYGVSNPGQTSLSFSPLAGLELVFRLQPAENSYFQHTLYHYLKTLQFIMYVAKGSGSQKGEIIE